MTREDFCASVLNVRAKRPGGLNAAGISGSEEAWTTHGCRKLEKSSHNSIVFVNLGSVPFVVIGRIYHL
jgi:hypothetical protein